MNQISIHLPDNFSPKNIFLFQWNIFKTFTLVLLFKATIQILFVLQSLFELFKFPFTDNEKCFLKIFRISIYSLKWSKHPFWFLFLFWTFLYIQTINIIRLSHCHRVFALSQFFFFHFSYIASTNWIEKFHHLPNNSRASDGEKIASNTIQRVEVNFSHSNSPKKILNSSD